MPAWPPFSFRTPSRSARRPPRCCRPGHLPGVRGPEWLEDRTLLAQGVISGVVFNDLDGGKAAGPGEGGLGGWTVYLDANFDGRLDAGSRRPSPPPTGATASSPTPGSISSARCRSRASSRRPRPGDTTLLLLASGETRTGIDFGNQPIVPGTISGLIFNDADSDGLRDPGRGALAGWTVYLDAELRRHPRRGRAVGRLRRRRELQHRRVPPGFYLVREVVRPNYLLTTPATELAVRQPDGRGGRHEPELRQLFAAAAGDHLRDDLRGPRRQRVARRRRGAARRLDRLPRRQRQRRARRRRDEPGDRRGGRIPLQRRRRHLHGPRGRAGRVHQTAPASGAYR